MDDDLLYDWVARRHPAPEPVEQRVRAARRRRMLVVLPLAITAAAVLGWTDWMSDDDVPHDLPAWRSVLGLLLMGVGAAGGILMWVRSVRSPEIRRAMWGARRTGLWALTGSQRRALLHQVLGKTPVLEEDLPGSREVARAYVAQKPVVSLLPFSGVLIAGGAVAVGDPVPTALAAATVVMLLVTVPVLHGRARRAERFLIDHPQAVPRA